jgi:hypothetical protein
MVTSDMVTRVKVVVNNRHFIPFRERAGYPWVTFRKTLATLLDEAGLTARQIADILGHAHPSMTQNTYLGRGPVPDVGARALEGIGAVSGKTGRKLAPVPGKDQPQAAGLG